MKRNLLLVAACLSFAAVACQKDDSPLREEELLPNADFTPPTPGPAGGAAFFVNNSQHATRYLWRFGDGTTNSALNPVHTYNQAGTYRVTLLAYNAQSAVDSVSKAVEVLFVPINKTYAAKGSRKNISLNLSPTGQFTWTTTYQTLPDMSLNIVQTTPNALTLNGYSGTLRNASSTVKSYFVNIPRFPNPQYASLDATILDVYPQGDSIVLSQMSHLGASQGYQCTDTYRSK